ncbi:hypothetical protein Dda_5186 [Drechslerella dactyloides]|uniref:Uncharacterized protein n=1 Tax=Drechslerella dactyloides TaxID=74499 RepID=A0AAD6IX30_DREDA|nr:hypothetical protein Dda_5186 [Drechslerella dactyloides]
MESKTDNYKSPDEISITSATTASLHSALDYDHDHTIAIPSPARTTPAPSTAPSMEYKRSTTIHKEYTYPYSYNYNHRDSSNYDYPPSEPCEYRDPSADRGDEQPKTLAGRLRRSMASISHCVQASGWALCCCGCLPCTSLCSACTGRRQSWG